MPDPEYICLETGKTIAEFDIYICPKCGEKSCPHCGGEVSTIQEYDEALKANE